MRRYITSIRVTFQGAYAINGVIGERQYIGYSKRVAIYLYNQAAKRQKGGGKNGSIQRRR